MSFNFSVSVTTSFSRRTLLLSPTSSASKQLIQPPNPKESFHPLLPFLSKIQPWL